MRKNLLAFSVLLATPLCALAASSVTLYGVVDEAAAFRHSSLKVSTPHASVHSSDNTVSMDAGNLMANRWGIKGTEDLGSFKVGFVLESGFSADNGALGYGGRLFGRESQLNVSGNWGLLAAGRVGPFVSGNGSFNMLASMAPWGNQIANYMTGTNSVMSYVGSRIDDSVTYVSPTFSGFSFRAQYSGRVDAQKSDVQNKASVTRYGAVAGMYKSGALYLGLMGDVTLYGHEPGKRPSNGNTITLGGSYDFTSVKYYLAAQYFRNVLNSTFSAGAIKTFQNSLKLAVPTLASETTYMNGFGVVTGVDVPMFSGVFKAAVAYLDGKSHKDKNGYGEKIDFDRYGATIGFNYPLSKRSTIYSALGYQHDKVKLHGAEVKQSDVKALLGLCHRF